MLKTMVVFANTAGGQMVIGGESQVGELGAKNDTMLKYSKNIHKKHEVQSSSKPNALFVV